MSGSTGTDRSISAGISLPQWMKTKIGDRYDLEQAAYSPPTEDDNFLFISYPKSNQPLDNIDKKPGQHLLSELQTEGSMLKQPATITEAQLKSTTLDNRSVADIFGSIFGLSKNSDTLKNEANVYNNRQRRNSKSLPASPLSSPKLRRRKNPYFTDPFKKSSENGGTTGWIWANMLSQRRSVEDLNSGAESASETDSPCTRRRNPNILLGGDPNPAEIREMNFWSPTSM